MSLQECHAPTSKSLVGGGSAPDAFGEQKLSSSWVFSAGTLLARTPLKGSDSKTRGPRYSNRIKLSVYMRLRRRACDNVDTTRYGLYFSEKKVKGCWAEPVDRHKKSTNTKPCLWALLPGSLPGWSSSCGPRKSRKFSISRPTLSRSVQLQVLCGALPVESLSCNILFECKGSLQMSHNVPVFPWDLSCSTRHRIEALKFWYLGLPHCSVDLPNLYDSRIGCIPNPHVIFQTEKLAAGSVDSWLLQLRYSLGHFDCTLLKWNLLKRIRNPDNPRTCCNPA